MSIAERVHEARVVGRRARVLGRAIAAELPPSARVLDIGCGDGLVASVVQRERPDIEVSGLEVRPRAGTRIPVERFDGRAVPYADRSITAVLLVDVLHHAEAPETLLAEATRVAAELVVIKDHLREGVLAAPTLRFMDRVGNRRHGVASPGVYWDRARWASALQGAGLEVRTWRERLGLYPWPASLLFERRLHFLAALTPSNRPASNLRSV